MESRENALHEKTTEQFSVFFLSLHFSLPYSRILTTCLTYSELFWREQSRECEIRVLSLSPCLLSLHQNGDHGIDLHRTG